MCKRNSFLLAALLAVSAAASAAPAFAQAAPTTQVQPLPAASQQARETLAQLAVSARLAESATAAKAALQAGTLPAPGGFPMNATGLPPITSVAPLASSDADTPQLLSIEGVAGAERAHIASGGQTYTATIGTDIGGRQWRVVRISPATGTVRLCALNKGGGQTRHCQVVGFATPTTTNVGAQAPIPAPTRMH